MSVAILLNPRSNAGRGAERFRALVDSELGQKLRLRQAHVWDGSDTGEAQGPEALLASARAFLRAESSHGVRHFVAAGGDGTVHLALNALHSEIHEGKLSATEHRLGAAGIGSSNDFHKPNQASGRDLIAGVPCRLDFEGAFKHDLGQAVLPGASPYVFGINASVGVTATGNAAFNNAGPALRWLKRASVNATILAVSLKTFASYENLRLSLSLDGGAPESLSLTNLGVVKNIHFSGDLRYDRPQRPNDGLFGVFVCRDMSRWELAKMFGALSKGRFSGIPKTHSAQASRVELSSLASFELETDGEVRRTSQATLTVLKEAITLCP